MPAERLPPGAWPLIVRTAAERRPGRSVQSAAMASDQHRISRTEARRRARLAARGELSDVDASPPPPEPEPGRSRGGILARMFPPAPPLAGRPDPFAGYTGGGSLGPVTSRAYLLRRTLLAWLIPGIGAFVGYIASLSYGGGLLGLLGTFILFGSLIAAGWFGWARPTLFGTAAALVGFILATALVLLTFAQQGAGPDTFGVQLIGQLFLQALYLSGLGFLGGWYGGYLRRRQAQLSAQRSKPRRR
jgi:hypothetical protein